MQDLIVRDLFHSDLSTWNADVVNSNFSFTDAAAILSIPLRHRAHADIRVWQHTIDGSYSVKSIYNCCINLAAETNNVQQNIDWGRIWQLKAPPRVRSFIWRLVHQCLPTRSRLVQKGIPCDDTCVVCNELAETPMHIFFVCSKATSCWKLLKLDNLVRDLLVTASDFPSTLFAFFDRLSISQMALAAMTLWCLWKCRNSKLWDSVDTLPLVVINRARDTLSEWSYMQQAKHPVQEMTHDALWEKPPLTVVKCNVDCVLFKNNSIMGYGLCFKDSMGLLLLGMSNYEFLRVTPSEAKASGLLEEVKLSIARGMQSVIFESDCKIVVYVVNSSVNPHNELGDIISYCKQLLSLHTNYFVRFVRRQANKVAHNIARASLSHPSPHIFSDVPSGLNTLLLNDMN